MKRIFLFSVVLNIVLVSSGLYLYYKNKKANPYTGYHWTKYSYWSDKKSLQDILPIDSVSVVFAGTSLTDGGEWAELFNDHNIKNRGIGGDNTEGLLQRLENIMENKPQKIFIEEGINDIHYKLTEEQYIANMEKIISVIRFSSPRTKIYINSILPTMDAGKNKMVALFNRRLEELSAKQKVVYIHNNQMAGVDGKLDKDYTGDGLHLNGAGYKRWAEILLPHLR